MRTEYSRSTIAAPTWDSPEAKEASRKASSRVTGTTHDSTCAAAAPLIYGADDAPAFAVRLNGDDIWISRRPIQQADSSFYFARLRRGMEQNIGLVQAKNVVALLARGESVQGITREIARFGAHHHRVWKDGMTTLTAVARLSPWLSETTLIYALAFAARRVAET